MKKQVRLYDIYRNIVTGEQSKIKDINGYYCKTNTITVHYTFGKHAVKYKYENEEDLREIVKTINKRLGNTRVPKGGK